ncbi:hypothetical protein QYM36_009984 [Artemia franciscana]|uniref:Uncharacterized protein n=1 Tax=Artemia franciscana TaxID=6661 RepID=A0AA88L3D1_ARTSF|nr:hypothetical protein QYM36_009984 [Artemia franciscana]
MLHIVSYSRVSSRHMVIQYRGRLLYQFQIEEHATHSHSKYSHMVIQYRRRLLYRFQIEEHATHSHLQYSHIKLHGYKV